MSELRPEDLTVDHFNHLTPTQAELLALLSEECGEVVQIVGKILRHGLSSCHPDGGFPNYRLLESEVGDFLAATRLIASAGMIDMVRVEDAADVKSRKVFKYLHHSSPPASEEKVTCPNCERKGDHYDQRGHYTCEPAEPAPPSEMPIDRARQIAAQCWCDPETESIEMDARLAEAFARRLVEFRRSQPAPAAPKCSKCGKLAPIPHVFMGCPKPEPAAPVEIPPFAMIGHDGKLVPETTDASTWAREFVARMELGLLPGPIDDALMIGWFANAIESGRSAGRTHAQPRPKLEKTRRALKCGQERLNIVFLSEETTTRWNNLFYEALAELDAAEGVEK